MSPFSNTPNSEFTDIFYIFMVDKRLRQTYKRNMQEVNATLSLQETFSVLYEPLYHLSFYHYMVQYLSFLL